MQSPPKRSTNFFKQIALPRRPKDKSILHLPVKHIQAADKPQHIIHAKSFLGSKFNPTRKFKLLFENYITQPKRSNPFAIPHQSRKEPMGEGARRRRSEELGKISKINQLIFKSELNSLVNKMQSVERQLPARGLNESRFSFVYLRRSFRVSQECKSSLLSLNQETRPKVEGEKESIAESKVTGEPAPMPIRKEASLRVTLRPKFKKKIAQRSLTKNEEIRGWEDNEERLEPIPSHLRFNTLQ